MTDINLSSKNLRTRAEIAALRTERDEARAENGRLRAERDDIKIEYELRQQDIIDQREEITALRRMVLRP